MPKMFEVGIICIIVLAVGYWVTLWLMGRHDDVLHGDFVHSEEGAEAPAIPDPPFPARPALLPKPAIKRPQPRPLQPARVKPAIAKPAPAEAPPPQPLSAPTPMAFSERSDTLQSLLASIKRDLKDASQL
jgi:hypothetical protein